MRSLPLLALTLAACARDIDWDCDDMEGFGWDPDWETLEQALWEATNTARSLGDECPSGTHAPVEAVTLDSQLSCAARGHALNMATNDFFDHDNLDGPERRGPDR